MVTIQAGIMKFNFFIIVTISLFSFGFARAEDLSIKVFVDQTEVALNQQLQVHVELSGSEANSAPQPPAPELGDFANYIGNSSSTSMQFVNGKMSVNVTYTHHFVALKEGQFEIPSIEYEYNGKTLKTKPISMAVVKGNVSRRPSRATGGTTQRQEEVDLNELVFLTAEVDKRQAFQNEAIIISYKIYFALQVSNYGIPQLPNLVGFWAENFELPQRPHVTTEVINGRQYNVAEIKKVALFPQGPGVKKLEPLVVDCEVQTPRKRRRRFDSFFDDPFFGMDRTVQHRIASESIEIDVKPLPENLRPADFAGAVGNYSISATANKLEVKANEAITLTLKYSGEGNIKILDKPNIDFSTDFEVYDPKVLENVVRTGHTINGSKSFEYVIVPRFAGRQQINPISFSYFDPIQEKYKSLKTAPITIEVKKGDQRFVNAPMATSKEEVKFIGQDIRFIQLNTPKLRKKGYIFYKGWLFYTGLFLPFLALVIAKNWQNHQKKLSSDIAYARSRKANQMALRQLRKAQVQLKTGDRANFYSEISTALMGFLGNKFNISSASLMSDEVEKIFVSKGISREVITEYLGCLQKCDFQRFAPGEANNGDMRAFFDEAKNAIINLDKQL